MKVASLVAVLVSGVVFGQSVPLDRAQKLYQSTDYRKALEVLNPASSQEPQVLLLAGKSWFMLGEFKKSTEILQKAVGVAPTNSEAHHWLGKAFGRRAETASFLTAPHYASLCRQSFEKAVALDGANQEAMGDLLEYYLEAPGIMGGGLDKAEALAEKIGGRDQAEKHYALARVAEKRKEYNKAEQHLRRASEMAPQQIGRVVDLARFLSKQGKVQESETAFLQAEKISPNDPKLLFGRAQAYIESKRNLQRARDLLEQYLRGNLTPDDPPRHEAERLLKQVGAGS